MSVMVQSEFKLGDRVFTSLRGWYGTVVGVELKEEYGTVRVLFDSYVSGERFIGELETQYRVDLLVKVD